VRTRLLASTVSAVVLVIATPTTIITPELVAATCCQPLQNHHQQYVSDRRLVSTCLPVPASPSAERTFGKAPPWEATLFTTIRAFLCQITFKATIFFRELSKPPLESRLLVTISCKMLFQRTNNVIVGIKKKQSFFLIKIICKERS